LKEPPYILPLPLGRGRTKEGEGFPFIVKTIVNNVMKLHNYS